ncbi:FtsK/SpoIIIE domain-containing protein [Streptomyces sp. NPDC002185]|uniref:FtsK/SpoIIIE domain-containing protein n=1 Tax=Streptomyces sp. NPDC002185 TaxID=3364636 RepID=UPI00367BB907
MTENVVPLFKEPPTQEPSPSPVEPLTAVPEPSDKPRPARVFVRTRRAVTGAVKHEKTRQAARLTVRHGSYLIGGTRVLTRRAWDGRTGARYERLLRAAEAAGNYEAAGEWEERLHRFREQRHKRRMDLLTAPQHAAKSAAIGTATGIGGLIAIGVALAIATKDPADVFTPLMSLVELVRLLVVIVQMVWGPLVAVGPWLALAGLWAVGRHRSTAPAWALPVHQRSDDAGASITPSIVVTALRDLGIAPLRNAIKEMGDAGAAMLGPIRIAGCGVEVDVTLPSGVSTEEVQNRRKKLAENLARHEHEVFITIPEAARTVRLWIADSGALDEPIGPSPLVTDETSAADYTKGRAPWGQDLRGDAATLSLFQRHLLITGLSNQGKTASLRALALWLALDRRVEFRIADLKGAGDWGMFNGIATVLIQGPTDDHVIDATEMVEGMVEEMERRLQAPPGTKFDPLIGIVDEAQVAFMCPAVGDDKRPYGGSKATSRYFMAVRKVHNQGRAVDVLMWEGTQDPTDQNLPKLVREGAHTRVSLVLGTESQARMALGDKAIDGGAAPHLLRQGLDKGTVVVASDGIKIPAGQPSITVRTHFIDDDAATAVAQRAKNLRDGVTTATTVERPADAADALADIAAVLGNESKMLTQEVLRRLAAANPGEYREWKFADLKQVLEAAGAPPRKTDGRMHVDGLMVADALARRDAETPESASQ